MDGEDLELFERSLRHATDTSSGDALDEALDELGWPEALADDRRAAVSTLFELQGAANATSSALAHVLTSALGLASEPSTGLVLPTVGEWAPPGSIDGSSLDVTGLAPGRLARREAALVVARTDGKDVAVSVPTSALTLEAVEGVDPSLGRVRVTGTGIRIDAEPDVVTGSWSGAVSLGRIAVGHELVGASRRMLELACEHALERVQFGQTISSFQAVRHRLAETLVAVEMAGAVLDAAWLDGRPDTAAMAKAVAGRQARTAARHCQQVLAGIGFTTEHPLHLFVRRTLVLDGLLGTSTSLTRTLGDEMIASRRLPPLLPL